MVCSTLKLDLCLLYGGGIGVWYRKTRLVNTVRRLELRVVQENKTCVYCTEAGIGV